MCHFAGKDGRTGRSPATSAWTDPQSTWLGNVLRRKEKWALERMGIHLSRRTIGRILAANSEAEGLEKPSRRRKVKREMPGVARL